MGGKMFYRYELTRYVMQRTYNASWKFEIKWKYEFEKVSI